jgi:hypothetical protein
MVDIGGATLAGRQTGAWRLLGFFREGVWSASYRRILLHHLTVFHRQKEIKPYGGNGISWTIHLDKLTFWHLTQRLAIPTLKKRKTIYASANL